MGFTMMNMVVYLFMTYLTSILTSSDSAYAIGEEIVSGSIAMRLIKPVNYDVSLLFQEIGNKIIIVSILLIPFIFGIEVYKFIVSGEIQFRYTGIYNFFLF